MSKRRARQLLLGLLALMVGAGLWGVLSGVAGLLAYVQRGADPATALNIVPNIPPDLHVELSWLPDAGDIGREIDPFTREQVKSAYLRAWLQWNLSYLRGEPYGLRTYFAGPALEAVSEGVSAAAAQGLHVEQIDTAHTLALRLYADDGSLVAFTDTRAVVAQTVRDASGATLFAGETVASYDVVMIQDEGSWRVYTWVRAEGAALDGAAAQTGAEPPAGFVGSQGTQLTLDGAPFFSAGINYYPQATPWDLFWPNYDPAIIEQDFAIIQTLRLNTVRIFIPFEQFGGARPEPAHLEQLADLLDRAERRGLKVIVTLFDFRTDYQLLLWPAADRHLQALLTRFADHSAILAWDLKNEPDRDYATAGRETVEAWLAHTARLARTYAPNHLITIGWSTPEAAQRLADTVDIVSFHYYAPATELPEQIGALRARAGGRPILLSEFGLPTWNSFFFPNGHSRPEQAAYYAELIAALRSTDVVGYLAWTLYDFDHVPSEVAGRWPWQTGPQRHLGVLDRAGRAKPAAALLAPDTAAAAPRITPVLRFLKPFWLTVMVVAGVSMYLLPSGARWLYRRRTRAGSQTPEAPPLDEG